MDKEKILQEAKQIMDSFADTLSKQSESKTELSFKLERKICMREEGEGTPLNENFKVLFLKNARKTRGDAIVAEKGSWV
ncbi:hypothetical protein H6501_04405 [Candidatus Woesearchaeota archaeon]|nr:hypothetical protein [Nanoarchaeota archaeon]MCB9370813.1 hypothetical protein [Candidatus Woesearchaeota archaeon]USN43913.1 MAG: hypothetical protein H6500_06005 [Candidatus Woesearchaeota archaeon]